MTIDYKTTGTCSRSIHVDVENDTIQQVLFNGGCNGNTQGVAALVKGMHIDEAISRIKGTQCGMRGTSCPDQLALALEEIKRKQAEV